MNENHFWELFNEVKVAPKPLPSNYNPDSFGRSLINKSFNKKDIHYSSETRLSESSMHTSSNTTSVKKPVK